MSPLAKILLILALIPILLVSLWDPNWFKSDIDNQLENVSSIDVQFDHIEHSLLQPGKLAIQHIELNGDVLTGTVQSLQVSVAIAPLFNKQVVVEEIKLVNPLLQVNMAAIQAMSEQTDNTSAEENATPQENAARPLPIQSAELRRFVIENANITDVSEQSLFAITDLNLNVANLLLVQNNLLVTPDTLPPATLELTTRNSTFAGQSFGQLLLKALGNGQQLTLNKLQMTTEQSNLSLHGKVKTPLSSPMVSLSLDESIVSMDEFGGLMDDLPVKPSGLVKLAGKFTEFAVTKDKQQMLQNLNGDLHIGMDNGRLKGIDINRIVQTIKDNRNARPKDLGRLLLKGSATMLAKRSTGLSWTRAALNQNHQTAIPQLRINSTISNGVLNLQQTALATNRHRVAFDGGINLSTTAFKDFTFAVLDAEGCAKAQQTLNGNLDDPTRFITKNAAANILDPLKDLFKKAVMPATACEPVYQGEVAHPN